MLEVVTVFLWVMIPISWSAGPNNVMSASIGARYGVRKAVQFILGLNSAILLYSLLVGFGFGLLIQQYPSAMEVLKYAGVLYIFYLAWKFLKYNVKDNESTKIPRFRDGFVICILNAKIVTAIALMFSQLLKTSANQTAQILGLTFAFVALCMTGHFMWAAFGHGLTKLVINKKAQKIQNYIFSGMLVFVGMWLFFN